MYLDDVEVLALLARESPQTPKELAAGRRRENVIRLQCNYLSRVGLVHTVSRDLYEIAAEGMDFLRGSSYPSVGGYLHLEEVLELPTHHITDFSSLGPTVIKLVNDDFYADPSNDYGLVRNDPGLTRRRIWNVKGWQLNRVMEEFPRTVSLPQQCAHWMRAMVGLHLFPDANHRTGMATLYGVLEANGVAPPDDDWPGKHIDRAVLVSKLLRGLVASVTFDSLWEQDELYCQWERYFRFLLYGDERNYPSGPKTGYLREVLNFARENRFRG